MGRSKAPSLPIKALSFCRPTELRGWQRNWIHRGAPRPANPVTCFPPGKVVAPATKGGCISNARRAVVKVLYKLAPSINLEAPSTTLSGIAAVKLKNPRGHSPVKL